jgi:hypothetical protein
MENIKEAFGRRHDAYTRDQHNATAGMGKHQSAAYRADGGANDEGWDREPQHKSADHPHAVHINGKKWKTFGSQSHASNVAKKIKGATVHKEHVEIDEAAMSARLRFAMALKREEDKRKLKDESRAARIAAEKKEQEKQPVKEAKDPGEYDQEGDMTMTQLRSIIYHAQELHDQLNKNDNLPEWVQSKITLAQDYVQTACDYMYSQNPVKEELSDPTRNAKQEKDIATGKKPMPKRKLVGFKQQSC